MIKLLFVTKSAQIQAPHPPTLRKVISKSASEPVPPAIAVVPSPHAPHYAQEERCSLSQHALLGLSL